jgi:hypothetical protein
MDKISIWKNHNLKQLINITLVIKRRKKIKYVKKEFIETGFKIVIEGVFTARYVGEFRI